MRIKSAMVMQPKALHTMLDGALSTGTARECQGSAEVAVKDQPEHCPASAEGRALRPSMRTTGALVGDSRVRDREAFAEPFRAAGRLAGCCTFVLHAASSSRSQVMVGSARAAACLTWVAPSVYVRWRPLLSVVIVTHLVTRLLVRRCRGSSGGSATNNSFWEPFAAYSVAAFDCRTASGPLGDYLRPIGMGWVRPSTCMPWACQRRLSSRCNKTHNTGHTGASHAM